MEEDMYGPLLFEDDLSADQRAKLRERMEDDPELEDAWTRWRRVRRQLRTRLRERLPDRRLLVLYALEEEGHDDVLTAEEQEALDAARDDLAEAIEAIPALNQVVERIQEDRAEFETVWRQHQEDVPVGASTSERRPAGRTDRDPRRPSQSREAGRVSRWAWRLTVAALLVGAAVLAVFYGPQGASQTTVAVAEGEQRVVKLGDGSTARLVGAARFSYPSDVEETDRRRVSLERGRAYFDVVPRDEASFVVTTPTATATVLGTQFGVATGADTTGVVLVEGSVQVASAEGRDESVVLESEERSTVRRGQEPSPPTSVDLSEALGWTGLFVFRSMPLESIAQRLSQHYDVTITVAPSLADEPVTGDFERKQSVSQILDALARTLGAEVEAQGDTYRLEPRP